MTGQHDPGGECAHLTVRDICREQYALFPLSFPVWSRAYETISRACGGDGSAMEPVWHWNDAHERTQAEVVAMFRALAATERAREGGLVIIKEETPKLRSPFAPVFVAAKQEKQS